ncbi:TIR domain-containing protein [Saccharothrix sp. Mg75]|uniref:TIR domain-containing protein n=1 Tax=Saccharothrix sp. Mg75 TaxID=3445357 RepID=UPI003EEF0699
MSSDAGTPRFDVFLSRSGSDRTPVRALARALRRIGVRVFLDEDSITRFTGISSSIANALASSKTLVAYYSADYAIRAACQHELMIAFLAGQREGDALRRVMVINPEPNNRHLAPAELADALFARPATTDGALDELAREIKARTAPIPTGIGASGPLMRPGPHATDTFGFVGRYRELWELHSGLIAPTFPMTQAWRSTAAASICGLPGSGKSALAAAYVTRFHGAHPAGAWWVSLSGTATSAMAVDAYVSALERFGRLCGPDHPGVLVVDDVPAHLDVVALGQYAAPPGLRTVFVSNENLFDVRMPVIELGPMAHHDAVAVLSRRRPPENDGESTALSKVAHLLGHHAGALVTAAHHLEDRQGLLSYAEYATQLTSMTPSLATLAAPFRSLIDGLCHDERLVLSVILLTGSLTIPARLLRTLEQRDPGPALSRLRCRMIAKRSGTIWRFEPLPVVAFQRFGKVTAPNWKASNLVAEAVREMMADPDIGADEWACVADVASRLRKHTTSPTAAEGLRLFLGRRWMIEKSSSSASPNDGYAGSSAPATAVH